jgi:hypothetical protein
MSWTKRPRKIKIGPSTRRTNRRLSAERQKDLLVGTILPATEAAYRQFVQENRDPSGSRRTARSSACHLPVPRNNLRGPGRQRGDQDCGRRGGAEGRWPTSPRRKAIQCRQGPGSRRGRPLPGHRAVCGPLCLRKGGALRRRPADVPPLFDREGLAGVLTLAIDFRHLLPLRTRSSPPRRRSTKRIPPRAITPTWWMTGVRHLPPLRLPHHGPLSRRHPGPGAHESHGGRPEPQG